jgi:hypothetical protein
VEALKTALGVVVVVLVFAGYLWLTRRVGYAAEAKGRSFTAWALIAMFLGPVIAAIMVAAMKADPDHAPYKEDAEIESSDPSDRLRKLKQLYEEGLVSHEEFAEKRRYLLDQL